MNLFVLKYHHVHKQRHEQMTAMKKKDFNNFIFDECSNDSVIDEKK